MKPLIVLISVFGVSLVILRLLRGNWQFAPAARVAMAAMLVFTSIAHFIFVKGMSMMLPDFIPFKNMVIYATGVLEIAAAIGLLTVKFRVKTAWFLIVFFILILPANIYAAQQHVDYQHGTSDGPGLGYLWFRIPLQLLFITWVYLVGVRSKD